MKNSENTPSVLPGSCQEPSDKYYEALAAYLAKYNRNGQRPMLPLRTTSTVGTRRVYLRGIGYLIAVFDLQTREFIPLTEELIRRHTQTIPES